MAMTVLDRPLTSFARLERPSTQSAELRCIVCRRPFNFLAGQAAIILKHVAYGYDFVHDGLCRATALSWIFVEPDYDRPAFSVDDLRVRILQTSDADGWCAALPNARELADAGQPISYEPLRFWALVEDRAGHRRMEGVIRADELLGEPGGAEFPEARTGQGASRGYVRADALPGQAARSSGPVSRARHQSATYAAGSGRLRKNP
jgi:hypothetical protein